MGKTQLYYRAWFGYVIGRRRNIYFGDPCSCNTSATVSMPDATTKHVGSGHYVFKAAISNNTHSVIFY